MDSTTLLLCLHVLANLVWIGSILAVAVALSLTEPAADVRGGIARAIYMRVSTPAFLVSFLAGVSLLLMHWKLYMVATHWMHGKLTVALIVIALHHVIGARAKALASGKRKDAGPVGVLGGVLLVAAGVAAVLAVAKPF
jgi:putative membrane protein